jgi:hypothetical protein
MAGGARMTDGRELLLSMCKTPDPEGTDEELVLEALKAYRQVCASFCYGGMGYGYKLSNAALDAFDRMTEQQMRMEI